MERLDWGKSSVLITGGTGSFGNKFIEIILKDYTPRRLAVFSRDELKQHEMRQTYPDSADSPIRYFIGDVRDRDRVIRAFRGVDIVVHAAALKQVPACEYNPFEAVLTNTIGAKNVIDGAIECGVKRVVALSSDKGVNPINLYGATKLVAEKLFVQGNSYAGAGGSRFCCVRYGNVVGSRGSVVPLFRAQRRNGTITITDQRMTRFWITVEQGVRFVIRCAEQMHGGEIFVPKIPSMRIMDLARAMAPDCKIVYTGIRPGEKLHELLVSEDEARHTLEFDDFFVVEPIFSWWGEDRWPGGKQLPDGYSYGSDSNGRWLTPDELRGMVEEL